MSSIREIQEAQLGLLEAVDGLCCKHDIHYALYGYTLLGAIRYKGFVPWDGGTSIAMLLDDYERFLEIAHELPDTYVVQSSKNSPHLAVTRAKVFVNGTTYMPVATASINAHWGISMDVFPLIGQEKQFLKRKLQSAELGMARRLRALEYTQALSLESSDSNAGRSIGRKVLGLLPFGPRIALSDWLLARAMCDPRTSSRVGVIDGNVFDGEYTQSDWTETITAEFEGREYPVPANYDAILRAMFGDYQKLPDKTNRIPRIPPEGIIIRDVGCDYRVYQRMLAEQQP